MSEPERQIMSLLGEAVEHNSPEERAAFLDKACAGDAGRRARVEELLRAYQAAGNFLQGNRPPAEPVATVDEPMRERPGAVIGPYKLLEQIGEGGFGVVFMAEQQRPVRRKVALKVLKPGMDTRQVVARFEAERQALALMDHPHIAKVLDGGETATGRPFFVMDLVKGVPITHYCDQNHLTARERLALFVQVCQAVQHAHQRGIIHRDVKPSNVLVSRHDGTPVVKVIDFGIAKALGQQLTDKTLFTNFAQLIGTPLYMSPEQAGMSDLDVDTRSDLYSLGVLLYELLTGTTPFDQERLQGVGFDELRRIIREEEPPRPSTRISTLGQAATTVGTNRKSDPKQLSRLCRGELDWIVMKALEKDRGRRYETANGFALDVQRYLADEPVQACPPSAWYRFRKFARRNKSGLAVAGLILFFIASLGGGGGWALRDRAAREEEVAKERRDREQRLTAQVEMILDEVDRLEREQKWPQAQAAAKRAEAALSGGDAGDAIRQRVQDALRDLAFVARLDRIHHDLATFVEGKFAFAKVVADFAQAFRDYGVDVEKLPIDESIARLKVRAALAVPSADALDYWVRAHRGLGSDVRRWHPLVAVARGLDHDPFRDQLRATWGRPVTPHLQADLRRLAESLDVKAHSPTTVLMLSYTLFRSDLPDLAFRILHAGTNAYPGDMWLNLDLGLFYVDRKEYSEAVRYCSAAVSIRPDCATAHYNLGCVLQKQGTLDEAIACYERAIGLEPNYRRAYHNLGAAFLQQKKFAEAIRCFDKALELDSKDPTFHTNRGAALAGQQKFKEAIACYDKAIKINPKYANAYYCLGNAFKAQGNVAAAIDCFQKAIDLGPEEAPFHNDLANALKAQKKFDAAIGHFHKAIKLDPKSANPRYNLGNLLRQQGKTDEAFVCYQQAVAANPADPLAHGNLGSALIDVKQDYEGAIVELRKAIALDPKYGTARYTLALALLNQGDFDSAITEYRAAICHLGNKSPWRPRAEAELRRAERLAKLARRLPAVLEGKDQPSGIAERLDFAFVCWTPHRKLYASAARFFSEAFKEAPKLGQDVQAPERYNAACAAARAGCGQGQDATELADGERAQLRGQALAWLRDRLQVWSRLLDRDSDNGMAVALNMRHWLTVGDFGGVRQPEALAMLPAAERHQWQDLWSDVADLLKRAMKK
jgi:serine/threonine protein kinase/tetratricopeptide (TPR) repeat protein